MFIVFRCIKSWNITKVLYTFYSFSLLECLDTGQVQEILANRYFNVLTSPIIFLIQTIKHNNLYIIFRSQFYINFFFIIYSHYGV